MYQRWRGSKRNFYTCQSQKDEPAIIRANIIYEIESVIRKEFGPELGHKLASKAVSRRRLKRYHELIDQICRKFDYKYPKHIRTIMNK
jgi:hypothetical protein